MLIIEKRRRRKKRVIKILALLCVILLIYIGIRFFFSQNSQPAATLAAHTGDITTSPLVIPSPYVLSGTMSSSLGDAVQSALVGTYGSYGIVIKNLKTNESYMTNEEKTYESGSLYKLWVMAEVYEQIKEGKLHESDVLTKNVTDLNKDFDIDPSQAEKTDGVITYSVKDALYQMITISDNYAALLLADKVGLSSIGTFLQTNGFSHSHVGRDGDEPVTTPEDIAGFFEKLYNGQLVDSTSSQEMVDLLKQQKLNGKIPEYLPSDVIVAHKTGELDDVTHDAGIVYVPSDDYIIVVLSQADNRDQANERIANVSQTVYNYFTQETPAPQS